MRVVIKALGLSLFVVTAVTGCSKREELKVAEFRDRAITVGRFEEAYSRVADQFLPKATGFEGKKEFLNTMLNKEVMAYKADELGYDKDPAVEQGMEGFRRYTLEVAYLRKLAGEVNVTDEDLRKHYANQGVTVMVKQILCDVESEAQEAYEALQSGTDFETACRQFSKSDDAEDGGTTHTIVYGSLIGELQFPVFDLPVGGFTRPTLTPHGWILMKVVKRSDPVHKESFEDMKEKMTTDVRRMKERVQLNAATLQLREDYGVTWYDDNVGVVFAALPEDRSPDDAPRRTDEVYPLLLFDPGDLNKPMVTYQGRTITIKDFSDYYDQASFFSRPKRIYRYAGVRAFLLERIMNDIFVDAQRKSGIENDADVQRILQAKKEEIMVNLLYEDMINKQTVVTAAQVQNYYNDNLAQYQVPEKRKFGVVLTGDQEIAEKAYRELKGGAKLSTVAIAYSIDQETVKSMGETALLSLGEQPELDTVGFGLRRVGDVSEPFQTSRGWLVLKLLAREDPKTYSLEEARLGIEKHLREKLNDEKLEELLAKWKEELGVTIHEDNLAKTQIVERSPAAPAVKPGAPLNQASG